MSGTERLYLLPAWVRLWHWTNALLIITLAVTGASLHFTGSELKLVEFSLAARIHDIAGVLLIAAYTFFVVANIVTGNWAQYVPQPPGVFRRCLAQARYYAWGIFRGAPHPHTPTKEARYNPLASFTYWAVMYLLMPVVVGSGFVFLYPQLAPDRLFGLDGLLPIAMTHYVAGAMVVMFLVVHVYLGTTGARVTSLFKMMLTGWHEH